MDWDNLDYTKSFPKKFEEKLPSPLNDQQIHK